MTSRCPRKSDARQTGYTYLRARYYDPNTGQFLTRDPLEVVSRQPYQYAWNNPVNFTDPRGMLPDIGGFFDDFAWKIAGFADTVGTWSGYDGLALAGSALLFTTPAGWAIGLTVVSTGGSATQWIAGSVAGDERHQTEGLVSTVTGLLGTSTWGALTDDAVRAGMSDLAVDGFGIWASMSRVGIDEAVNHADIDSSGCGC